MRIWLDDVRPMPNGFDFWAKNYYEMMGLLISGNVTHISFDHDLGLGMGGYDVAKYIEGLAYLGMVEITWDVHSANPAGRRNIELAMKSAERFWKSW